uniref:EF-hand domain-containing protein n=1 Tax=Ciona savignyi TaxID=51511 RepID=H2ZQV1_CIOSA
MQECEFAKCKALFKNHEVDGLIDVNGIKLVTLALERPLTDEENQELQNGKTFDFGQFWKFLEKRKNMATFRQLDRDRDGLISVTDLHLALCYGSDVRFTYDEIVSIVKRLDSDGDGFLSFQDFVKFLEA